MAPTPLRCIHIPLIQNSFTDEMIVDYFAEFGEIEATRRKRTKSCSEVFVLFKKGADATSVLITCNHQIQNVPINVFASDLQSKDFPADLMEVDKDTENDHYDPTKISLVDLNDDCLLKIISYLDTDAFCSLALTNSRIYAVTENVFFSKYREIMSSVITKKNIELVLRAFGHLLTEFKIRNTWHLYADYNNDLLNAIVTYCSGNLKRLDLTRIILKDEAVVKSQPLFESLEKLTLDFCSNQGKSFAEVFKHAKELKSLKIFGTATNNPFDCSFLMHHFPKLQSVRFSSFDDLQDVHLQAFIEKNPNLKKLKICNCGNLSTSIYQTISDNLTNLEDLRVYGIDNRSFERKVMLIAQLKNLKKLNVQCTDEIMSELIAGLQSRNTLTHLQVSCSRASMEVLENIMEMPNLVFLKLDVYWLDENYIRRIKSRMQKLRQHFVFHKFERTYYIYQKK